MTQGPRRERLGDNRYGIDPERIVVEVREANAALFARAEALADAATRVPGALDSDTLIDRARKFRVLVAAARRELRAARLADGKPFRQADAMVTSVFTPTEKRLERVEREVARRLTEAAMAGRRMAAADTAAARAGIAPTGGVNPTARPEATVAAPDETAGPIRLRWEVAGYDRATLDLEPLRMFLTDTALLAACRKHLEENGPGSLAGVTYREAAVA